MRSHLKKVTVNIILYEKILKAFLLKQECLLSPLLFNIIFEVQASGIGRGEKGKYIEMD